MFIGRYTGDLRRTLFNRDGDDFSDSRRGQRLHRKNSSTAGSILFPMTFRTAAAYLVAKVRLYDTFNISFKVYIDNKYIIVVLLTGDILREF